MWRILAIVLSLWSASALAQTGTPQTKSSLNTEQGTNFSDNTAGAITPLILRQTVADMIASWQQAPRVNAQVGTTYTVVVDDYGKLLTFTSAAAVVVTVPQATGSFATFNFMACNQGAGAVTLTPTTSTINGVASYILPKQACSMLIADGANYQSLTIPGGGKAAGGSSTPTTQTLTSGTNATYTTSAGASWIEVRMIGGGGGGGANSANAGANGGDTCWNTSGTACTTPVYQAGKGSGGAISSGAGGAGGTISGSGVCTWSAGGQSGATGTPNGGGNSENAPGGAGGNSSIGGGGNGSQATAGIAAATNTGSGGQGGSNVGVGPVTSGSGGGAGATCFALITAPAATYTYTIGAAGNGGAAGGSAGGNGAAGRIDVVEHYGP